MQHKLILFHFSSDLLHVPRFLLKIAVTFCRSKEADSSAPGSAVKFSIWQPARVQLNPPISNFTYTTWAKVQADK